MLSDKVALVTGGIGDLGNEMALHLSQAGARVAVWDLYTAADARQGLRRIATGGQEPFYQRVDVTDRNAVDAAMDELVATLERIDVVCSNAGIVEAAPFLEMSQENWQRHLNINLTGCFNVAQSAARQMVEHAIRGRIIFTSTWVSMIPWPEITAYTVSKAGVNMLMKQMARELAAYGICVNAIAPGIVNAGIAGRQMREEPQYAARVAKAIPLGEPGTPVEIAQAIVYLAGPHTEYMTGSVLVLDGGCSLFQFDS